MTPIEPEEPVCELCNTPGLVCELTFRRGRPRRVCVVCLADAIEKRTRWRMGRQVRQYILSTAQAPKLSAMAKEAAEQLRAESEAIVG